MRWSQHAREDSRTSAAASVRRSTATRCKVYRAENAITSPLRFEIDPRDVMRIHTRTSRPRARRSGPSTTRTRRARAYPSQTDVNFAQSLARRDLADRVARRSRRPGSARPFRIESRSLTSKRSRLDGGVADEPSRSPARAARCAIRWRSGSAPSAACRSPTPGEVDAEQRDDARSRRAPARSSRSTRAGELRRVATGRQQPEAEFIQMLLLEEGVPSTLRRTAGFDVPDMLAAGPRDVLVPESGLEAAREVLLQSDIEVTQAPHIVSRAARSCTGEGARLAAGWQPASRRSLIWLPARNARPTRGLRHTCHAGRSGARADRRAVRGEPKSRRSADDVVDVRALVVQLVLRPQRDVGHAHRGKALAGSAAPGTAPARRLAVVGPTGGRAPGNGWGRAGRGPHRPRSGRGGGRRASACCASRPITCRARSRRPSAAFASR